MQLPVLLWSAITDNLYLRKDGCTAPMQSKSAPRTAEAWRWRAWMCRRVASVRILILAMGGSNTCSPGKRAPTPCTAERTPHGGGLAVARMEVPPRGVRQAAQQRAVALLQARDALHQPELRLAGKQVHIPCPRTAGISLCSSCVVMVQNMGSNIHE